MPSPFARGTGGLEGQEREGDFSLSALYCCWISVSFTHTLCTHVCYVYVHCTHRSAHAYAHSRVSACASTKHAVGTSFSNLPWGDAPPAGPLSCRAPRCPWRDMCRPQRAVFPFRLLPCALPSVPSPGHSTHCGRQVPRSRLEHTSRFSYPLDLHPVRGRPFSTRLPLNTLLVRRRQKSLSSESIEPY